MADGYERVKAHFDQAPVVGIRLPERLFCPFALGDIPRNSENRVGTTVCITQEPCGILDPDY